MKRQAAFAVALGLGLLAAGLVFLGDHGPATLGSDRVPPGVFVRTLAPGQRACLAGQSVPRGARSVQLVIGTYGRPSARLAVVGRRAGGAVVVRGGATTRTGVVRLPVRVFGRADDGVILCLFNRGTGPVALGGSAATVSVVYPAMGGGSWLDEAGAVVRRFDHVRIAPFGRATMWLALILAIGAAAGAAALTIRGARDD